VDKDGIVGLLAEVQKNTIGIPSERDSIEEEILTEIDCSDSQIEWLALSEGSPTVLTPHAVRVGEVR
jgi:hypothetical protein